MFPCGSGVRVVGVKQSGAMIRFNAVTTEIPAPCQVCGVTSTRVRSRYSRQVGDVAVAGREVALRLAQRRLSCCPGGVPRNPGPGDEPVLAG